MTTGNNRKRGRPRTYSSGTIFRADDTEMRFVLWSRKNVDLKIESMWSFSSIDNLTKEDIQTIIDKLEELKGEML